MAIENRFAARLGECVTRDHCDTAISGIDFAIKALGVARRATSNMMKAFGMHHVCSVGRDAVFAHTTGDRECEQVVAIEGGFERGSKCARFVRVHKSVAHQHAARRKSLMHEE